MLSSIKRLFRKCFKSEPKQYVDDNIQLGTSESGASKPEFHPENETVLDESSGKPTSDNVPPPPYSPPLNSNHRTSAGFATRTDEPSAASQVEVHVGLGGGMVPMVSVTAFVSTPMWQSSAPMDGIPSSSDDSVSYNSDQLDSDSGSYVENVKGNYRPANNNKHRSQAHDFQHTSPPGNRGPSHSRHEMPGQGSASANRAFGPDGAFDAIFGQGGTFDTVFGRGGTFDVDAAFGSSGIFQHGFNGGNASQSTHYTHRNVHTHFSSASPNGEPSSHTNPDTRFDAGDDEYWTGSYDDPTRNKGGHDFRREKGGSTSGRDRANPGFQENDRPPSANQDTHRQGGPFAPFFGGSTNISINACNVNIVTSHGNTTIHTTANSSRASPQFRSGGRGTHRNV